MNIQFALIRKKKKRNPGGIIILLQLSAAFEIIIQFGRREIHFSSRGCKKKKKKPRPAAEHPWNISVNISRNPCQPIFQLRPSAKAGCFLYYHLFHQDVNSLSNFTFKFLSLVIRLNSRKELFQACIPSLRWNNPAWYSTIDITLIICSRIFIFKQNFQIFQFEQ